MVTSSLTSNFKNVETVMVGYLSNQTNSANKRYQQQILCSPVRNSCTSVQLTDQDIFLEKFKWPSCKNRRPTSFIKEYSKCKLQLHIISESVQILCKRLRDWGMRRCFRISLQECQNVSVETWIRASKFSLKIQSRSEDINKIQTEFPRSQIQYFYKMECTVGQ